MAKVAVIVVSSNTTNDIVGDVLIPFFFKEEYGDRWGFYYELWGKNTVTNITNLTSTM